MKEIKKAEARFRPGLDDDIKAKYNTVPEKERSTVLRDALRLWFGITNKIVVKQMEVPLRQPERREVKEDRPVTGMPKVYRPK